MKKHTIALVLVMVAGTMSAFAPLPQVDEVSAQVATLTAEESKNLLFMIEEEKMARDLYTAFYGLYGSQAFQTIASSEQVHMDELKVLLNTYGISDPTEGKAAGVFTLPNLQVLYDKLLAQGSVSLTEALKVGATVEEIDILDLQAHMEQTQKTDILDVYAELKKGSENHLRAYVRQINNQTGEVYTPSHLSVEEYQRITTGATGNGTQGLQGGQGMRGSGRGKQGGLGTQGSQGLKQGQGLNEMQGLMDGNCVESGTCETH